ncbi:hypothetical protein ABLN97_09545 [Mycobacterium tuberculosis]
MGLFLQPVRRSRWGRLAWASLPDRALADHPLPALGSALTTRSGLLLNRFYGRGESPRAAAAAVVAIT